MALADDRREWLEADGLGGFASGTVAGPRTRRYHALLLVATSPPTGRVALVNGCDVAVVRGSRREALSGQAYRDGLVHPDGPTRLRGFSAFPWPRWTFELEGGLQVEQELFVPRGRPWVALRFRAQGRSAGATLELRPFLSGRDYHALHRENPACDFSAEVGPAGRVRFRPYAGLPSVHVLSNGSYHAEPHWYRRFVYEEERARGLDHEEDLAAPGLFRFDLSAGEAVLVLAAETAGSELPDARSAVEVVAEERESEARRRAQAAGLLERAAEAYLVRRGAGQTLVAGYPWFTDWGRDTFIALRGLCLATGRFAEAARILVEWSSAVSQGMLPNRFPDRGEEPEYNSVDASLWYVVAVHELLEAERAGRHRLANEARERLRGAVRAILDGYRAGTRHGIRADSDGLLAAGEAGQQLTWMDARVDGRVITPRSGKPVEVQALWLNVLRIGAGLGLASPDEGRQGCASFERRFWNEVTGGLHDVVDVDHERGRVDPSLRPNQVLAVGGLPFPVLAGERARRVVDLVERELWTPLGLRTLAPGQPGYRGRYQGGVAERDEAYHQGTAWPWLLGPFVEAWVRVRGETPGVRLLARERFVLPLLGHLEEAGLGHVSEIADAEAPQLPRGCPFQAWSLGELLRLERRVLAGGA